MKRRPGKPKRVSYELIEPGSVIGHPMYALLRELVHAHHEDLRTARIALAWNTAWKPDVDGLVTLGKCKKASDLDRELAAFDFIILLRRSFWTHLQVTDLQRRALLDHELSHAAVKFDDQGEPMLDERGRQVYRLRKHDLEEFTDVVNRHGIWSTNIHRFAVALRRSALRRFEPCAECRAETPGWVSVVDDGGTKRMKRCPCWLSWTELRTEVLGEGVTA